jgi:septal ring factor EnvC (AmiA/AmiB activator)
MEFVSKHIILLLFVACFNFIFSQNNTEKLKKEQDRLEKNIAKTKSLLDRSVKNTEATLNELKVLENQVKYREELLNNFDNQIRGAELKIEEKDLQIVSLQQKLELLKIQYKKLVIYTYKKRSTAGKMMFIFSANSYFEAVKRNTYLKKLAELQVKQKALIQQHQGLILTEKQKIQQEKDLKMKLADEKRVEREKILVDKSKQEKTFQKLQGEQQKLSAKLQEDERNKEVLKRKIKEAIDKEIALAEKARKEKEKKLAEKKKAAGTSSSSSAEKEVKKTTEKVEKEITISETKELTLNKGFESNKGRLPWPVEKGTITESYGKHAHPTLPNVTTNNNGVDISAPKGAQVRCVYEGEVTSVFSIPGAGKVVIVKHGNYRTVYSNLQDVYVAIGAKVNTKQALGSLLAIDGENLSVAHFEIHQVLDGQVNRMNPGLWIAN